MFKKCKYCGKELKEWGSSVCPHCHKKQDISFGQGCLVVLVIVVFPLLLVMLLPNDNKKVNNDEKDDIKVESNTSGQYDENNINKVITCNDKEITIKKVQRVNKSLSTYVPDGHEWIGIYVIYKNVGEQDMNYLETDFHLLNKNKEVLNPVYNVVSGVFDHERLNNGTIASGGTTEGYVVFDNDLVGDKELSVRITCENSLFTDDKVVTVDLK